MDRSERVVSLSGKDLLEVKSIILLDGSINKPEIARRGWSIFDIDDKAIFDEDAINLAKSFRSQGAFCFFVSPIFSILNAEDRCDAFRFKSTREEVEFFQGAEWHSINLDDCLLFDLPMNCAVRRPGTVDTTSFMGNSLFIKQISRG
ncbi:hypothetical protein [Pandoraea sp. ISTKB]|uniref:hypothetical protein n=1 Tax=Pandoraea sp. ISTKB TaxID=1586708 RepID=UPI001112E2E7|nr:hypothetical protein [Pandoraea sp. ISTKB]